MSISCEIDFERNPLKVIHSGQQLRGIVSLKFKKQKKVCGIYIRLYGGAYASWTEFDLLNFGCDRIFCYDYTKTYTVKEEHFNERAYFLGDDSGVCVGSQRLKKSPLIFKMSPGVHSYTFDCTLPSTLPTSVEGKHGHIKYLTCVVVDVLHSEKRVFQQPFTVIKPIDLNAEPEFRNPIIAKLTTDDMQIFVLVPVCGYTPGQVINLEIDVNNKSKRSITEFGIELVREIVYSKSAKSNHHKVERVSIVKTKTRGCEKYQSEIIAANIPLPSIPPTDLTTNPILKISYFMRVVGFVNSVFFRNDNPKLEFPITIGSRPIQDDSPYSNWNNGRIPFDQHDLNKERFIYEETLRRYGAIGSNFRPTYPVFKRETSYSIQN
ncbi:arrestin domain-containing protein 17-like [Contarinia nasturtii]|uniref:arrestin domain-containing protein 17-like n=1 Tax=Contarinia nasturtii TaxID=265458 RepID=UPI0012D43F46|nr:arrestin domain-containing protein 17-like [Contarinia nasturtii]